MCLIRGTYNSDLHKMTFPIGRQLRLRDENLHVQYQQDSTPDHPVFGVKGVSPLSTILNLPTCAVFDAMHLIHLGIARKLLHMVVNKKLVNVQNLSKFVSYIKVPHYFRRRPKNLDKELSLWKAQEHKVFLLYFSPFCLYKSLSGPVTDAENQICLIYLCLASFIYSLSSESVTCETLNTCKDVILIFQSLMARTFGEGVKIASLHALIHLPSQVENFGHLPATSAYAFENVNRFLKRSVTGKIKQGHQIGERFLRMQCAVNDSELLPSIRTVGAEHPHVHIEGLSHLHNVRFATKVFVRDRCFHSFNFGRRLRSSSYFAFIEHLNVFVKVKTIVHSSEGVYCLCRVYIKHKRCWVEFAFPNIDESLQRKLNDLSNHFSLRKGILKVFDAKLLSHHAIISKVNDRDFFGVKIINDYEHD